MKTAIDCGPNEGWRKALLASALGTAASLTFSPWLEAVLAPASILFAASFQVLACNKKLEVTVEREVVVKESKIFVRLTSNLKNLVLKDLPSAPPVSGEPIGKGELSYVIDAEENPFVYWPGVEVRLDEGPCTCSGLVELRSFASSWRLESLGLGEPVEVEGGFLTVPEVEGAREYRPGDEPRLIIWKTLYKPGGPRVKELKRVTEMAGLKKGISTFSVEIGEWEENKCMKAMATSLSSYLREIGLREVRGPADVVVIAPGASPPKANLYLLLNPLVCVPTLSGLDALELVRRRIYQEFLEFEKTLKNFGGVRAVPWSVPPHHTL